MTRHSAILDRITLHWVKLYLRAFAEGGRRPPIGRMGNVLVRLYMRAGARVLRRMQERLSDKPD